jgi:hypothetical protein
MLLLAVTVVMAAWAETYPAQCRVNTTLNVREGAGTWYGKVGRLHRGDLTNESIQRIPGGMAHWLFRSMVIEDIATSIEEHL